MLSIVEGGANIDAIAVGASDVGVGAVGAPTLNCMLESIRCRFGEV